MSRTLLLAHTTDRMSLKKCIKLNEKIPHGLQAAAGGISIKWGGSLKMIWQQSNDPAVAVLPLPAAGGNLRVGGRGYNERKQKNEKKKEATLRDLL